MNIEDLIRMANPVSATDVAAGDSPHAQRTLARIMTEHADPVVQRRRPRARLVRKPMLFAAGLTTVAAGATAAVLVLAGLPPGAAPRVRASSGHHPAGHATTAGPTTARQVLLTAAAHVLSTPTTGTYWRVQTTSGTIWPGGTTAHPYDISVATSYDQWNPKTPGQKEFEITQQLATRPATPADAAAWRAAGSPTRWDSGQNAYTNRDDSYQAGVPWVNNLSATSVASAPSATWTVSDGTVGYIEGDEAGLNAAQFSQMPTQPSAVAALLRKYVTACAGQTGSGCFSVDQFVWSEALFLLLDPVSAQVRSATYQVMASLPGVRLLGPMTDPLGRSGYGLTAGPQDPNGVSGTLKAVVIDPASGSLLATEDIGPIPSSVQCMTQQGISGGGKCVGEAYVGRSYPGQVDQFVALVSAGWTDASPSLPPATHEDPLGFPGLPPAVP